VPRSLHRLKKRPSLGVPKSTQRDIHSCSATLDSDREETGYNSKERSVTRDGLQNVATIQGYPVKQKETRRRIAALVLHSLYGIIPPYSCLPIAAAGRKYISRWTKIYRDDGVLVALKHELDNGTM